MTITEARILMADGTEALYVGEAADMPALPPWPFLALSVKDLEEAQDVLDTLERSRARKKASEKEEPEPAPGPGPLPPKCEAPECPNEGRRFEWKEYPEPVHFCDGHIGQPVATLREWHLAFARRSEGKQRAKGIREGLEKGAAAEPGKVA